MNSWIEHLQRNKGSGKTFRQLRAEYRRAHPACCGRRVRKGASEPPPKTAASSRKATRPKSTKVAAPRQSSKGASATRPKTVASSEALKKKTPPPPKPPSRTPSATQPKSTKVAAAPRQPATELTVATVNAWDGGSTGERFAAYMKDVAKRRPDLIFLQEAPLRTHKAITGLEEYRVVSLVTPAKDTGYERMMTLLNTKSSWKVTNETTISSSHCNTPRVSTVHDFKHPTGARISIANVHLCGGRFDEAAHCTRKDSQKAKLSMLTEVITKHNASIVLGDFNSDFLAMDSPNADRLRFLESLGCTSKDAQSWHDAPYKLLASSKYSRVPFTDATSQFGTLPDGIFYAQNVGIGLKERAVLEALKMSKASDHNGLLATFTVR